MAATSTTTLLDAVNQVLLDVGERRATGFNFPAANKARDYLQETTRELGALHDWEWLYDRTVATSWNLDTATLSNVQKVRAVDWNTGTNLVRLAYVDPIIYDEQQSLSSFLSTNTSSRPLWWTISTYNTVRVNPYPADSTSQAKVFFYVIRDMTPPTTTNGLFPVPEYIMPLIRKRAVYYMNLNHLGDVGMANAVKNEFEQMLSQHRTRQTKTPSGGWNMYKRGRRYPQQ